MLHPLERLASVGSVSVAFCSIFSDVPPSGCGIDARFRSRPLVRSTSRGECNVKILTRDDAQSLIKIFALSCMLLIASFFFWAISAKADAPDPRYQMIQNAGSSQHQTKVTRHHRKAARTRAVVDANGGLASGLVQSKKTGASARVSAQYAPQFQAYIDDLEANGAVVRFLGGIRHGKCWSGGLHPCGKAIDVCQLSRGRVDARCRLPGRDRIAQIAAAHGLFEGGQWCHSDYGHAQVGTTAAACGSQLAHRRKHTVAMR